GLVAVRKPTVDAGYGLFVLCALGYAGAIVVLRGVRLPPRARRALVALAQAAAFAFVAVCWIAQRHDVYFGIRKAYFTNATLLVAAAATVATALVVHALRSGRLRADPLTRLRRLDARAVGWACLAVAVVATVVWVLPAIHTDRATPSG